MTCSDLQHVVECVAMCRCMSYSVAVCVAVCVVVGLAVYYSMLQCVLQCVAVCCSVLQCAAVCCSVLQCAAVAVLSPTNKDQRAMRSIGVHSKDSKESHMNQCVCRRSYGASATWRSKTLLCSWRFWCRALNRRFMTT